MAWSKKLTNVLRSISPTAFLAVTLACLAAPAMAQGIYTCTDAKGRRLTADRPIIDCIDREQTELSSGGLARRKIGPTLTAAERAAEEERAARAGEERSRLAEEKKRDKALVMRYPNRSVHDKERVEALTLVDRAIAEAQRVTGGLLARRKLLDGELEFYKAQPARTPPKIKKQVEEVESRLAAQTRFVAEQDLEKVRINARFDEELVRLNVLWSQEGAVPTAVARGASAARSVR